jgi:hypothetical protein
MPGDPQVTRDTGGLGDGMPTEWGYIVYDVDLDVYTAYSQPTGVGYAYIEIMRSGGTPTGDEQRAYWSFTNQSGSEPARNNQPGDQDIIENDTLYFRISVTSSPVPPPGESITFAIKFYSGKDIIGAALQTSDWGQMSNAGGTKSFGTSAPSGDYTHTISVTDLANFVPRDGDQDIEIQDASTYTWGVTGSVIYRIQHRTNKLPYTYYDGHNMDWKRIEQHFNLMESGI